MSNLPMPTGAVSSSSPVAQTPYATTAFQRLRILETYRTIAMVGLSSNPFRPNWWSGTSVRRRRLL